MRKGFVRIIFGTLLIAMQILSFLGNSINDSQYQIISLTWLFGYLLMGICGVILVAFGIKAYRTGETAQLILHKKTKVSKFVFGILIALMLIAYIFNNIKDMKLNGILYMFSAFFMLIYLFWRQGKKPSFLFSASVIFTGCALVISPIVNIVNLSVLLLSEDINIIAFILMGVACGFINILSGVLIYREKFSIPLVKILGWIAFLLFSISNVILWEGIHLDISLANLLQLTIFVYICFIPISTNKTLKRRR